MAVRRPIANAAVAEEERTLRAVIETPSTGDYSINVTREIRQLDKNDNVLGVRGAQHQVTRKVAAIVNETVTIPNGTIMRAVDVLEALRLIFDRWAGEDEVARARPVLNDLPIIAGRGQLPPGAQ